MFKKKKPKKIITDEQFNEIILSVKSHVTEFGIEGAVQEIRKVYKDYPDLLKTMLFMLEDLYNIRLNKKTKKMNRKQEKSLEELRDKWERKLEDLGSIQKNKWELEFFGRDDE